MSARRSETVEPFLAVEVFERAQALERQGADVVHLEFGEPDFETPAVIVDAAARALKDGRTRYVSPQGILPLREAIAEHYATAYGVRISPDQVLVTPGTSPAMMLLFGHLLAAGDEVVMGDPYYACYPNFVRYADGRVVCVDTRAEDGFQLWPEAVAERLGPRTRAILINSPANPTGSVLPPDRLAALAGLGPIVVSDEIYHGLSYEGPDRSILEFTDRAFVLNGFSKAFAMTGWRLGYLIGPPEQVRTLARVVGNFFISTNEFVQWAAVAALREARDDSRRFRQLFDERRHATVDGLRAIGLGVGAMPAGAFYVLASVHRHARDSTAFAFELLERCHVALTPGAAFGTNAERCLRVSYAAARDRIEEGLRRIGQYLETRR